ncbi:hypothetical protein D3C84_1083080 [compost metagenome]
MQRFDEALEDQVLPAPFAGGDGQPGIEEQARGIERRHETFFDPGGGVVIGQETDVAARENQEGDALPIGGRRRDVEQLV